MSSLLFFSVIFVVHVQKHMRRRNRKNLQKVLLQQTMLRVVQYAIYIALGAKRVKWLGAVNRFWDLVAPKPYCDDDLLHQQAEFAVLFVILHFVLLLGINRFANTFVGMTFDPGRPSQQQGRAELMA